MIALLVIESTEAEATQVSVYNISADSASANISVVTHEGVSWHILHHGAEGAAMQAESITRNGYLAKILAAWR